MDDRDDIPYLQHGRVFMDGFGFVSRSHIGHAHMSGPVDLEGRPVNRTKQTHPYNYDGHVIWRGGKNVDGMHCVYTDRLQQWDAEKYSRCCSAHMDKVRWDNAKPEQIEAFLRAYNDDDTIHLVAVMEWCNQATGYPVWSLHYVIQ